MLVRDMSRTPDAKAIMANILIADDEEGIRTLLSQQFRDEGHTVQAVADGLEALKACRVMRFDILFCDLFMPGMEGLETIRNFRKEFSYLSVVAMSGATSNYGSDFLKMARTWGVAAVLEKPFRWGEVRRILENVLLAAAIGGLTEEQSLAPHPAVL